MKVPPGRRDADALTNEDTRQAAACKLSSVLLEAQGLNRRFVTLRIAPGDTHHQAPGLCRELLEHHPVGVGDAAWPPERNRRAGFPGTLGLRRPVGVGCRGYRHCSRSEEHTSELQSLRHLVCRLLLEKKKKTNKAQS